MPPGFVDIAPFFQKSNSKNTVFNTQAFKTVDNAPFFQAAAWARE